TGVYLDGHSSNENNYQNQYQKYVLTIMFTSSSLKLAPSNQDTIFGIVNSALSPPAKKHSILRHR
ncbi:hypothetical protein, partial [Pseudoalteromonas sp. 45-MNA-CIBAN-0466]|uniref:hypothetical protein n=1 Tax=Pseudoalteromonas sp. 45-MNA-CIBAN-0466 TaxID=3140426 RepID=UPI00332A79D4